MFQIYPKYLKKQLCEEVCIQGKSTLKTATESIQQKFLPYDDLSKEELRKILMRKDIEIARLKKVVL